ncbi:MAG: hypothetical protein UT32_C0007G0007 [Parcubacteria group bacterium GW2011_GWC2_39_14]|nr:MAG: hypothetical protein UT32_C0007G0007 [Parcubacteria group bacterium GW2011_GWC2_39_14]KKR55033.1 MAG: hypothetical protein UT91_C0005G0034 [Parcubacteria group bacterium GW2011_GWA2_40_23]
MSPKPAEYPPATDKDNPTSPEAYLDLPNVQLYIEKLENLLKEHPEAEVFVKRAKSMIYDMLTRRSEFIKNTEGAGLNVAELMEAYQPQMAWYKETKGRLVDTINASKEFKWESNPGWFGVNTRPEEPRREEVSLKVYATIPITEYAFLQHIPELMSELRQLSIESDDVAHIKFPESLTGFISNNDSIVIHFKKKENVEKIQKLLDTWMKAHGIHEEPREMGRTKVGADPKGSSFSDILSKTIAEWLEQNAGKYDNALLAREAAKHAIEQSQKKPF